MLNVPPPEVTDHAADVAPPPMVAPLNVIGAGVADWHTVFGPPAFTVDAGITVTVALPVTGWLQTGADV